LATESDERREEISGTVAVVGGSQAQHGFFVFLSSAVGRQSTALFPRSIVLPIF
jgi:hypothetical protein